jgi:hypothetical protein
MSIALMIMTFGQAAAQPLPRVDGTRLRVGTVCYAITQNDVPIGATLQKVERARVDGVRAWRIVIHQRLADGRFDMRDTFVVRRADLRPISFDSRRGSRATDARWQEIHLDYGASRIRGTRAGPAGSTPIDVPLSTPVWEGNLWSLTFAALPLRLNGRYRLPYWQYDKGFGSFDVSVVGSQTISIHGRRVEAWVVEAGDNPTRSTRYLIGKRDGADLGYTGTGGAQRLGGDCTGLG